MIKLVIADSNQLVCAGLTVILRNFGDIQVLGEAHTDDNLESLVISFLPDIVMIDFAAPGFSIDIVQKCLRLHPRVRFVAITGEQNGITIVNALRAGITSYIKKDCDVHEIVDSVSETHRGSRFFCGKILDTIRREEIDVDDLHLVEATCDQVVISEREQEVIKLIAEGYTNNEIAVKLFLSPHTVNTHRKNIMTKLGVNNTAAIVMYAVKTKLVSPNKFLFSPQQIG